MNLISKIEALYKDKLGDGAHIEYNQAIDDVVVLPEIQIIDELIDRVQAWWDDLYPEDIFDGSSGDEGVLKLIEIRQLLKKVHNEPNK